MAKINGIGALMIYADNPARLADWYATHLGLITRLDKGDNNYYGDIEDTLANITIHLGIYHAESKQNGRALMVNYRVDDFEEFIGELRRKGVEIKQLIKNDLGRFAYISDPEGNPIEIWSPT